MKLSKSFTDILLVLAFIVLVVVLIFLSFVKDVWGSNIPSKMPKDVKVFMCYLDRSHRSISMYTLVCVDSTDEMKVSTDETGTIITRKEIGDYENKNK